MKKWDKMIIATLFIISFVPHIIFGIYRVNDYEKVYAVISVGGKIKESIPLTGQMTKKEYRIETEYGINLLVVENEQIAMIEADCPDKVCKGPGFIKKPGESLVCLPNRLYVQIEGSRTEQDEIDIKAY